MRKFNSFRSLLFLILVVIFFLFCVCRGQCPGCPGLCPLGVKTHSVHPLEEGQQLSGTCNQWGKLSLTLPCPNTHYPSPNLQQPPTVSPLQSKCCKMLCCLTSLPSFSHKRQLRKIKLTFSGNGNWVIFSRKTLLFSTGRTGRTSESSAPPLLLQQL